jgi:FtsP/CotA-like multicopper oxidase with cupredoxin domain
MKPKTMNNAFRTVRLLLAALVAGASLIATAHAAAPGITGPSFNLTAQAAYITQPDGQAIYSWGYGCNSSTAQPGFMPATISTGNVGCPTMQIPGPTLIVTEGDAVSITLSNSLPSAAGNTSILFPGFTVATAGGQAGLLTQEAVPGGTVTYSFTASAPGTHSYYSGTQGDLQIEMGLYGALIVLPKTTNIPASCNNTIQDTARGAFLRASGGGDEFDYRLAHAAYGHIKACYDREYLFQFSEIDPRIHSQAQDQVAAAGNCTVGAPGCSLNVATEPYSPAYFMINGRSMPDDMDANYAPEYPHQPYNGNPHMHPGEMVLLRIIGQGRWQHPFHEHANHVRVLARDGNLILSQTDPVNNLAGPALFTTTTTPGQTIDGIFYYTGRGLNWDMYGHNPASADTAAKLPCVPDANGYFTGTALVGTTSVDATKQINFYEWCQDHNKPVQAMPFGDVASGGPVTLPDSNILTNGAWFGGSPYLGPDATTRATGCLPSGTGQSNAPNCGGTATTPPSGTIANSPSSEAGFAFMWHSHNEREITTNNAFPGGMMMMMLVDSREFSIDESN